MSRDIKYIGMDVHKIAVLNRGGQLVMESIVETKAMLVAHGSDTALNSAPLKVV